MLIAFKACYFFLLIGQRTVRLNYMVSAKKSKVVNFGANIESYPTFQRYSKLSKAAATNKIKLLFLAKSWERKGGDIVLAVAKSLHESGYPVELSIVGYTPNIEANLPYVTRLGFISKQQPEGKKPNCINYYVNHISCLFLSC